MGRAVDNSRTKKLSQRYEPDLHIKRMSYNCDSVLIHLKKPLNRLDSLANVTSLAAAVPLQRTTSISWLSNAYTL